MAYQQRYSVYKSSNNSSRRGGGGGGYNRGRNNKKRGEYIDPSRFVKKATMQDDEPYMAQHTFDDFDFLPLLHENVRTKGYVTPSPIQDQTIAVGLEGRDVIGVASTGTGKTAAFALPVLNTLMLRTDAKVLIVAPTRELAQQIEDECRALGKGSGLTGALLIGGVSMMPQLRDLKSEPRIVIGTPGRIKDHVERGTIKLNTFNIVVLDEVDRMLDMGFYPDVSLILDGLAVDRQSFFFSATLDGKVSTLIHSFANDAVTISLKPSQTSDSVNQDVVRYMSPHDKMDKLNDILLREDVSKVIVFDETQRSVEKLSIELAARGFSVDAIHGGKTQGQRQRALDRFKASHTKILVATDVAARGIDVADISHVINYSEPQSYQDYIHRIGRAGRAGKIGHALTFVN